MDGEEEFFWWNSAVDSAGWLFRPRLEAGEPPDLARETALRDLAQSWRSRLESAAGHDVRVQAYADALSDCADELLALIGEGR